MFLRLVLPIVDFVDPVPKDILQRTLILRSHRLIAFEPGNGRYALALVDIGVDLLYVVGQIVIVQLRFLPLDGEAAVRKIGAAARPNKQFIYLFDPSCLWKVFSSSS